MTNVDIKPKRRLTDWLVTVAPPRRGEMQFVEELGPKGRRRAIAATIVGLIVIGAAIAWVVRRFQSKGQFAPELWRPFRQWAIWRFLLIGLLNTLRAAGIAVRVTVLPVTGENAQVLPQLIPAGVLFTRPRPLVVTASGWLAGLSTKAAVTARAALIVTTQVGTDPLQS